MVVNNWWVVVNMTSDVVGNVILVRLYFVSFWITVVLILVNIMIAIVLEIYGSVSAEVDKNFRKQNCQQVLYKMLKDDDVETMKEKILEASKAIERLEHEVALRERLSMHSRPSAYEPGINRDHDPQEHAFNWNGDHYEGPVNTGPVNTGMSFAQKDH